MKGNVEYQSHVSFNLRFVEKVKGWRDFVFHSPNMELKNKKLEELIKDVITLLQDEKELKDNEHAKKAVENLKQLKTGKLHMIMDEAEAEVLKTSMEALEFDKAELKALFESVKQQEQRQDSQDQRVETLENGFRLLEMLKTEMFRTIIATDVGAEVLRTSVERLEAELKAVSENVKQQRQRLDSIDQRVVNLENLFPLLEKKIKELESQLDQKKHRLETVQKRIEFRTKLAEWLQNNFTKVSACLQTAEDCDIDVSEVYVFPSMTREIKSKDSRKMKDEHLLDSFDQIFQTHGKNAKRIYVLGDVGSGKNTLCQAIIKNWCNFHDLSDSVETSNRSVGEKDFESTIIKDFMYLFYVPLIRAKRGISVTDMIRKNYECVVSSGVLDDILQSAPEKCLVILDGLDEWKPGPGSELAADVTYGLPDPGAMRKATFLTTSRPSATGIVNLKSKDCDQKILLKGVPRQSMDTFVERYRNIFSGSKPVELNMIIAKLNDLKIADIEKTPLFMQQIVWLLVSCKDSNIGNTVSEVYSNILNNALWWMETKNEQTEKSETIVLEHDSKLKYLKRMVLPQQVVSYPRCSTYRILLLLLGKIAVISLTDGQATKRVLGGHTLLKYGITDGYLQFLLKTGLIKKEKSFNPALEKTHYSFIHTSYLEFLAAMFVVSSAKKSAAGQSKGISEILNFTSVENLIQHANVLKIVCELDRDKILDICRLVYDIVRKAIELPLDLLSTPDLEENVQYNKVLHQLHDIVVQYISDYDSQRSSSEVTIPVFGLIEPNGMPEALIKRYVDCQTLLHFVCDYYETFKTQTTQSYVLNNIRSFANLQTLMIEHVRADHAVMLALSKFISQTETLHHIKIAHVCCSEHAFRCKKNEIELLSNDVITLCLLSTPFTLASISTASLQCCIIDDVKPGTEGIPFSGAPSKLKIIGLKKAALTTLHITEDMVNLRYINLVEVNMNMYSWYSFLASLSQLCSPVTVVMNDKQVGRDYVDLIRLAFDLHINSVTDQLVEFTMH